MKRIKYHSGSTSKTKIIEFYPFNTIENLIQWVNNSRFKTSQIKKYPSKLLLVDFSKCPPIIKPYHITPLACIIHEYRIKGYTVKLKKIPSSISGYLKSFNFEQFCNNESPAHYYETTDNKVLPLYLIDETSFGLYPDFVMRFFEKNHFDGKSLFTLSSSLGELMNNIFDHSGSKIPGYSFSQYNSSKNSIITGVCDFGHGIPVTINRFLRSQGESEISNDEALLKAFEIRFSTLSKPHNRGFGLDNVLSAICEQHSRALIISNNVLLNIREDGEKDIKILNQNFPGTLFVIWLNTKDLPIKENEIGDEGFL